MIWEVGEKYISTNKDGRRNLWLCHGRCAQNGFPILEYMYDPRRVDKNLAVQVVSGYSTDMVNKSYGTFEKVPADTERTWV